MGVKSPNGRLHGEVLAFSFLGQNTDARENGPRKEVERWLWGLSLRALGVKLMGFESQID